MKLSRFIIVKLTLFLILGICLGYFIHFPLLWSVATCAILLGILGLLLVLNSSSYKPPISFGLIALLLMIAIGVLTVASHNQALQSSHYSHLKTPKSRITFKIKTVLKPNTYYHKYVIDILKVNNHLVTGTALLNIKKDSLTYTYFIDDVFVAADTLQDILPPLNPNQFNYKAYLERQYIYHQMTTTPTKLLKLQKSKSTLLGEAYQLNRHINNRLQTYPFGTDELAIMNALFLGQRQDISAPLYTNYTKAGVIHILAVSGLHVGILLMILNYLLAPLERFTYGKITKTIMIIIIMWCFAFLTGLSPSVSRATLMFTLVAISINSNRPSNIFNTVAISAFLLLLWKPLLLLDVGFQLSYAAVLSIITFQPTLNSLWYPKHKLSKLLWNTLTVTTAAQIGVLPLSIYYFHQFPGLFFLSNVLIVPVLGYVLGLGILIITLAMLQLLPNILVTLFNKTITIMNAIVNWIAAQDAFIFDSLTLELNTLFCIYALLFCFIYVYTKPKFKSVTLVLLSVIILQITVLYNAWSQTPTEWILFHKNRQSILAHRNSRALTIYQSDTLNYVNAYPLKDYMLAKNMRSFDNSPLKSVYQIHGKNTLIVDCLSVYQIPSFKPHYVLLRNSPKLNLNRLIDSLNPNKIIADGSNYTSYIARWETTCKHKKIPFYYTGKKGAYNFKE